MPDHGPNGLERIPLQPIVHIDVSLPSRLITLSFDNHRSTCFAGFVVHFHRFVIRLERFDSVFVLPYFLPDLRRNRAATNSGFVRLPDNAICSLTGGIASHELKTCVTP